MHSGPSCRCSSDCVFGCVIRSLKVCSPKLIININWHVLLIVNCKRLRSREIHTHTTYTHTHERERTHTHTTNSRKSRSIAARVALFACHAEACLSIGLWPHVRPNSDMFMGDAKCGARLMCVRVRVRCAFQQLCLCTY